MKEATERLVRTLEELRPVSRDHFTGSKGDVEKYSTDGSWYDEIEVKRHLSQKRVRESTYKGRGWTPGVIIHPDRRRLIKSGA